MLRLSIAVSLALALVSAACSSEEAQDEPSTPARKKSSGGKGGSSGKSGSSGKGGSQGGDDGGGGSASGAGGAVSPAGAGGTGAGGTGVGGTGASGSGAECQPACAAGQSCCNGKCINSASDPNNCGGCKITCISGSSCIEGKCKSCQPGETISCYDGPEGTKDKGICKGGKRTCSAQGEMGPCEGQVTPKNESCATPEDDDCNGSPLECTGASEACDPVSGACVDACSPDVLAFSYIGCVYYPTVTPNQVGTQFTFAVAVSNTNDVPVQVSVKRGATDVSSVTVDPKSVQIVGLPWIDALKGPASLAQVSFPSSVRVDDGAYRLEANRPVTVYQYSPLEYTSGGGFTFTNDASLLMPVNAWRKSYLVAARGHFTTMSGFYTVVASQDGTTVTVQKGVKPVGAKGGVAGLDGSGAGTLSMNEGDVVTVVTSDAGQGDGNDFTGALITADKPIQVFGGHQCTFIPSGTPACDHLEESMFPTDTLASGYLVSAPLIPNGNVPKANMVRIVALESGTDLTFDPPQGGAPASIAQAGDWAEFQTDQSFQISSSKRFLVAQYMLGQEAGGSSGDPAMALVVPTAQYRTSYLFHAPTNYEKNFVTITAPTGADVKLDGAPAGPFTPIGNSGYGVVRVQLPNSNGGNHTLESTQPAGITVYGYGQYTSYWYPGGLDLRNLKE